MEILDIPEKLQQAILNPDKRLTVDLRVRQYKTCTACQLSYLAVMLYTRARCPKFVGEREY
jgi:hypothetical protein